MLDKLPAAMILRPTHFVETRGEGGGMNSGGRMMFKCYSLPPLLNLAYGWPGSPRTVFPDGMPTNAYDFLYTLPGDPYSALRQELARRFGYVAHAETRETDVWLLEVISSNESNLKPARKGSPTSFVADFDSLTLQNQPIGTLADEVEGLIRQPVLDRTGLKGKYDATMQMKWDGGLPSADAMDRMLRDQLGLELVSGREPIKLLVVEKSN